MYYDKISSFILNLRKENNMTQQELADKLHVTDKAVSKWETGRGLPDIGTLKDLAELFNVTEKEILNGERNFKKKAIDPNHHSVVLEVNNLTKFLGRREILHNINLKIYEGDIVGLIGPNGAGKTTLIKTITSLYKINSGSIKICSFDIKKEIEDALSKIGCIIENPDMYKDLTGRDNIEIIKMLNSIKDNDFIEEMIDFVKLRDRIDDKVKKYSLGMKQRLALLCALIKKPKLLILDEPTNGLDPKGIKELREMIKKISIEDNISVLISSHILKEVENICDRIIIINNGSIINEFGIEEVKYKNISLEDEYFKIVEGVSNEDI